jgi:hypothetical protein
MFLIKLVPINLVIVHLHPLLKKIELWRLLVQLEKDPDY